MKWLNRLKQWLSPSPTICEVKDNRITGNGGLLCIIPEGISATVTGNTIVRHDGAPLKIKIGD